MFSVSIHSHLQRVDSGRFDVVVYFVCSISIVKDLDIRDTGGCSADLYENRITANLTLVVASIKQGHGECSHNACHCILNSVSTEQSAASIDLIDSTNHSEFAIPDVILWSSTIGLDKDFK